MSQAWAPGMVTGMLERAGAEATRPREVEGEYGLIDGAYRLSEVQAQAWPAIQAGHNTLIAAPTGSGKTTTLHSCVGAINTPERKIWTVEDPVEYRKWMHAGRVNELALPLMERLKDSERLFLWLHYSDPHAPYILPEGVENPFVGDHATPPRV